jgi:hypothetical protein
VEGGIAILLLLVIAVIAVVIGIALYLTGGTLSLKRDLAEGEGAADAESRPTFKRVDQPEPERVRLAGTPADERAEHEES